MRILVATDGSPQSEAAVADVASRPWPAGTEFEVLAVIHSPIPPLPSPAFVLPAAHAEQIQELTRRAPEWTRAGAERIRQGVPQARVTTRVREGVPQDVILEEAAQWGADRIILGSHGHGPLGRLLLGSVAEAVIRRAPCSVEVIRAKPANRQAAVDVRAVSEPEPSARTASSTVRASRG